MYIGFVGLVLTLLALDLGVFHRHAHVIKVKEALKWSAIWIACGLAFTVFIYFGYENHWLGLGMTPDAMSDPDKVKAAGGVYNDGASGALKYVTGYLVEKSLAVDNIFVIALVFASFKVPAKMQHRVLYWGILGALIMRGAMIALGASLIREFAWVLYVFGGFLVITGLKMLFSGDDDPDPQNNVIVRIARKIFPVADSKSGAHGEQFFVRVDGKLMITTLFLVLILVEFSDLIFAVDSIPAVFGVTTDAFLVFTSNVFAILGLRSLYFALAGMMDAFKYLKVALAFVLMIVGVKMLAHHWIKGALGEYSNLIRLGVILGILSVGIIASLAARKQDAQNSGS